MRTHAAAWHCPRRNSRLRHVLRTGRHAVGVAVRALMPHNTTGHTETLKNLSTNKMSMMRVPIIVAEKLTIEASDMKLLVVALPCSFTPPRLRTRKQKAKSEGSERGHDSW